MGRFFIKNLVNELIFKKILKNIVVGGLHVRNLMLDAYILWADLTDFPFQFKGALKTKH